MFKGRSSEYYIGRMIGAKRYVSLCIDPKTVDYTKESVLMTEIHPDDFSRAIGVASQLQEYLSGKSLKEDNESIISSVKKNEKHGNNVSIHVVTGTNGSGSSGEERGKTRVREAYDFAAKQGDSYHQHFVLLGQDSNVKYTSFGVNVLAQVQKVIRPKIVFRMYENTFSDENSNDYHPDHTQMGLMTKASIKKGKIGVNRHSPDFVFSYYLSEHIKRKGVYAC